MKDLEGLAPVETQDKEKKEKPLRLIPPVGSGTGTDTAVQAITGPLASTSGGLNFAGVGNGDYGFTDQYAPPDTNSAVGATQYIQWVNAYFAVFNKSTGTIATGPLTPAMLYGKGSAVRVKQTTTVIRLYSMIRPPADGS